MPWLPVLHTPEGDVSFFSRRVLPAQAVDLAVQGGLIRGFIAVKGDWLNHLYIHPGHWRAGLGSALLKRAMSAAPALQLWVFQQNTAARAFYIRHGFAEAEFTDGAGNEERRPDLRMVWTAP